MKLVKAFVDGKWWTGTICYRKGDKTVVALWDDTIVEVTNENLNEND